MARRDNRGQRTRGGIIVGLHVGKGRSANPRWSLLWGACIAVIGLALLLDNLDIFPAVRLYRFWPLILVAVGMMNVACRSSRFFGILLMIVGALFQLSELNVAHFSWGQLWPIILISVGILVMWSSLEARRRLADAQTAPLDGASPLPDEPGASAPDPRNALNEVAIFGGVERRMVTQDFRGGSVNAIFGGVELDLSKAAMQQPQAELEINAIFGGVELRVPDSWQVITSGQAIFGAYDDKTGSNDFPDTPEAPRKMLVLTGSVIFGGVEIKS